MYVLGVFLVLLKGVDMSKTLERIRRQRAWVSHIDDERGDGNSIIVTLARDYTFTDNPDCGVQGFDTVREVELFTRRCNVTAAPHFSTAETK